MKRNYLKNLIWRLHYYELYTLHEVASLTGQSTELNLNSNVTKFCFLEDNATVCVISPISAYKIIHGSHHLTFIRLSTIKASLNMPLGGLCYFMYLFARSITNSIYLRLTLVELMQADFMILCNAKLYRRWLKRTARLPPNSSLSDIPRKNDKPWINLLRLAEHLQIVIPIQSQVCLSALHRDSCKV